MPEPAKTVWDKDKTRGDAERAATSFDDSAADFDSTSVFFDGFDPSVATKEGEAPTTWTGTPE